MYLHKNHTPLVNDSLNPSILSIEFSDNQEQVVQQDELVEFPKNTPHEVINISQKKLRVLVIRHK
ncbi:MAG: hypothetical protein DRP33_01370 [Thermotogae bacterium]|nr:MAG: hypothetical protein DRP33_01370 [Thermotogota bacterium]